MTRRGIRTVLAGMLLLVPCVAAGAEPLIVASIKPVHALVAGVMRGVATPRLLIRGAASPHDYSLRPSDVMALDDSQAVFWIGEALESFLVKPLANAGKRVRSVPLLDAPGLSLRERREGGPWEADRHGDDARDHRTAPHPAARADRLDPHIWLDPRNAIAMVRQIGAVLNEVDPIHRADYTKNAGDMIQRLETLDRDLAAELAPVRDVPYIVFHDGYQYFEVRYGLDALGSVVVSPEQRPGAKRLHDIRERLRSAGARCVFSEPQFESSLVGVIIEGTDIRRGVLDPLGADLQAGYDLYFELLRNLAASLRECLTAAGNPPPRL